MKAMNVGLVFICGVLVSVLISRSVGAQGSRVEIECPEEIKTKQTPITPPKGWATHVDTTNARQLFTGLAIYDGHPKDGATLFADESAEGGSDASAGALYKIPAGREGYLVCQYTNTLVRLIKKLPKDIQSCRVKFSETLGHVQKAVCE